MPRGVLVIRVKEAVGKNKAETIVWDPNFIEGFVRSELRTHDGKKTTAQTQPKRVLANQLGWDEELRLDVNDSSKELRLMLCREKKTGTRVATSVIAACGIFMKDILEAAPIDKYFELFKPGAAGEGGFIRVSITYEDHQLKKPQANGVPSPGSVDTRPHEFQTQVSLDPEEAAAFKGRQSSARPASAAPTPASVPEGAPAKRRGPLGLLKLAIAAAAVGAAVVLVKKPDGLPLGKRA